MKKLLAVIGIIGLIAVAATAFAHGPGGLDRGYGACEGNGACGGPYGYDNKFLDETSDLRKELHAKKFEYMEAVRDPKADDKKIAKLEKEIDELQDKIHEKAPKRAYGRGYGRRGGYGCR